MFIRKNTNLFSTQKQCLYFKQFYGNVFHVKLSNKFHQGILVLKKKTVEKGKVYFFAILHYGKQLKYTSFISLQELSYKMIFGLAQSATSLLSLIIGMISNKPRSIRKRNDMFSWWPHFTLCCQINKREPLNISCHQCRE